MQELLKRIYNEILIYEKDIATANTKVDNKVNELIAPYQNTMKPVEYEKLKDIVYNSVSEAEQTGFKNGMRFTLKMLYSILNT